jgi:hypothetical protein
MTPLHQFGEFLRESLQIIPLSMVRLLFVGTLVVLLVWVLRLPRSATTPPEGVKRWDENLKLGATIALLIQIIVYLCL